MGRTWADLRVEEQDQNRPGTAGSIQRQGEHSKDPRTQTELGGSKKRYRRGLYTSLGGSEGGLDVSIEQFANSSTEASR